MTAEEQAQHIAEKILPQLQEIGIEAFVLAGYASDGDGKVHKVTLGVEGSNPAYADGLRTLAVLTGRWGKGEL
jgi:hypothetical protein